MEHNDDDMRSEAPWWAARRPSADPRMRVSDAERAEVAEELSRHYAEGRFDAGEFQERLDKAMAAKTRGDLAGLLDDVPRHTLGPPLEVHDAGRHHHPPRLAVLVVAVLVLGALSSVPPHVAWHVPWILVALVVALLWRRGHARPRTAFFARRRVLGGRF